MWRVVVAAASVRLPRIARASGGCGSVTTTSTVASVVARVADAPAPLVASRPSDATTAAERRAGRRCRFITVPACDDGPARKSVFGVVAAGAEQLVDEDCCS